MLFQKQNCSQNNPQTCSKKSSYLKNMVEYWLLLFANIFVVLLGMDGAMDDIPFFCPASTQVWLAYHSSKKRSRILPISLHCCLMTTVPWMTFPSSVMLVCIFCCKD
jgi:hypothetical protein